ncbi:hypothetical protein MNBD_NITROSPINAE02-487 [hydrothermal vent metagenome]|uniref:Uncharacterized protein n=1 Tax=hydrothermal vent metagenome TaxID=652676 RepID=A0A3B1CAV6_9ZZZZ
MISESNSLTALVVDDDPAIALIISKSLTNAGFAFEVESNGEAALGRIDTGGIDIVLLDQHMPGMGGEETLAKIVDQYPNLPVIMVTGHGDERLAAAVMKAGAKDYLVKDIGLDFVRSIPKVISKVYDHHLFERQNRILQEKLAKSELLLRNVVENSFQAMLTVDTEGTITRINHQTVLIFGWRRKELEGHSFTDTIIPPSYREEWRRNIEIYKTTGQWPVANRLVERRAVCKDGREIDVEMVISPLKFEDEYFLGIFMHDISDRKETLRALYASKEKAERATKLKDEFVSLVAHDLKSPFTSILGTLRLLETDMEGMQGITPRQQSLIDHALENGDRLVRVIDDLLNISRLQTGALTVKPKFLDGSVLAAMSIGMIAELARQKGIEIINAVKPKTRIFADPPLFKEVLHNLLLNAIKFTRPGGRITIFSPVNDESCIAVKDTGVGVARNVIENIFRHEVKTSLSGTAGETGTGLGLPYSHDIMVAHGGSLSVESEEDGGAVFFARLPKKKPRVLVVEDEEPFRVVIREFLEEFGAEIIEVANGAEALETLASNKAHLVICDLNMPVMNGYDFLKELKASRDNQDIPVIVVTVDREVESREKAIRLGADDFMTKPFTHEEFIPRASKFIV